MCDIQRQVDLCCDVDREGGDNNSINLLIRWIDNPRDRYRPINLLNLEGSSYPVKDHGTQLSSRSGGGIDSRDAPSQLGQRTHSL